MHYHIKKNSTLRSRLHSSVYLTKYPEKMSPHHESNNKLGDNKYIWASLRKNVVDPLEKLLNPINLLNAVMLIWTNRNPYILLKDIVFCEDSELRE